MLYSRLALLLVLLEYGCAAYGYFGQSSKMLYHLFLYGSPIYMVMNLLNHNSALLDSNVLFILLFAFHVIKYALIFKSQISDDRNMGMIVAVVLEMAYLGTSAYLLY